jgi:hypothetical protein
MLKKVLLGVSLCALGLTLFIALDGYIVERHAESFLAQWESIKIPGDATQIDAIFQKLGDRYTRRSQQCTASDCDYYFAFQNTWINRLHLAPRRTFGARVVVTDGRVVYKELSFTQGSLLELLSQVSDVDCYPCRSASKPYQISINGLHSQVVLTPSSTREERVISYQFNLKFLNSVRHLRNTKELQPALMAYAGHHGE